MPEGPETERVARKLRRHLGVTSLSDVYFKFDALKPFESRLRGRKIVNVSALGKAILIETDAGLSIYAHCQLYGRWYMTPTKKCPSTTRDRRLSLSNQKHAAHLYSASDIDVLDAQGKEAHPYLQKLGLKLFGPAPEPDDTLSFLRSKTFAKRTLGLLLLDQSFIAGMGNYLRSEVLFACNLGPNLKPCHLSDAELLDIYDAARRLANRSLEHNGLTNDPATASEMHAQGIPRRHHRHAVFGRAYQPCLSCGSMILQTKVAGRRFFACPSCQPI